MWLTTELLKGGCLATINDASALTDLPKNTLHKLCGGNANANASELLRSIAPFTMAARCVSNAQVKMIKS